MSDLFKNELLKLKRSKSVKALFWYFILFSVFCALFYSGADNRQYGFYAPFEAACMSGASGFFLFAAIAAEQVANEFSQGIIHNAISCGVERRGYFIAKTCSTLGITAFIYLSNLLVLCLCRNVFRPFDPYSLRCSRYWQKAVVFNLAALMALLCYMSLFICIAYLCRRGVMTFVTSMLITIVDYMCFAGNDGLQNTFGSPLAVVMGMTKNMIPTGASSDRLLEPGFFLMLLPSLCMGAVSLIVAYQVFKRVDIN